jgi:phage terminase large subunit GpA-like protein
MMQFAHTLPSAYSSAFEASVNRLRAELVNSWQPPPRILASEAAEDLYLSREYSKESGQINLERYPYLREIIDRLSDSDPVKCVIVKACIQSGKSVIGQAFLVYTIVYSPAAFLWVTDTDMKAQKFSKQRLDLMVRDSPELRSRVAQSKGRRGKDDTIHVKTFPGGIVTVAGAQSISGLVSDTFRRVVADELDIHAHDVSGAGSTWEQILGRLSSWGSMAKALAVSSPSIEGESPIDDLYHLGDQRVYEVPCPHCGKFHAMEPCDSTYQNWNLVWTKNGDYSDVKYICPFCGVAWEETDKDWFLPRGEWVATRPDLGGNEYTSYYWNFLILPFGGYSWASFARQYDKALELAKRGDYTRHKGVVNTRMARTYRDLAESIDPHVLRRRVEAVDLNNLPSRVRVVTMAADVQMDRIEVMWVGWGPGFEAWILKHQVLYGDPGSRAVWRQLDQLRTGITFQAEDGRKLRAAVCLVDSGNIPEQVYAYTTPRYNSGVFAIKGLDGRPRDAVWDKTIRREGGSKRKARSNTPNRWFSVRTVPAKDWISVSFGVANHGPRYIHISADILTTVTNFLDQLVSERREVKVVAGRKKVAWRTITDHARNEALDCLGYNLAAVYALQLSIGLDLGEPDPTLATDDTEGVLVENESAPNSLPAEVPALNNNAPKRKPRRRQPGEKPARPAGSYWSLGPVRR